MNEDLLYTETTDGKSPVLLWQPSCEFFGADGRLRFLVGEPNLKLTCGVQQGEPQLPVAAHEPHI